MTDKKDPKAETDQVGDLERCVGCGKLTDERMGPHVICGPCFMMGRGDLPLP